MEIKGKTVVVTGAARGIGRAIAAAFAREGANLVAADLGARASKSTADWHYSLAAESELARTTSEISHSGGVIINIASNAGKKGSAFNGPYCASKAAVIGLTQSMAAELAESAIRVNAICPGNIDTSMWFDHLSTSEINQRRYDTDSAGDTFDAVIRNHVPLGRGQTPKDIAEAALYLTRAENVTGISLTVAGGFVMN